MRLKAAGHPGSLLVGFSFRDRSGATPVRLQFAPWYLDVVKSWKGERKELGRPFLSFATFRLRRKPSLRCEASSGTTVANALPHARMAETPHRAAEARVLVPDAFGEQRAGQSEPRRPRQGPSREPCAVLRCLEPAVVVLYVPQQVEPGA